MINKKFRTKLLLTLTWGIFLLPYAHGAQGKDFNFPEIVGWKKVLPILVFKPQNLFDYIDGAADLYLSYDFEELLVAEYKGDKKASITVEIYRHRNPTMAFGIYSQERLQNTRFIEIGNQGYIEPMTLNFWMGPYYVKIISYEIGADEEKTLLTLGKAIEATLGEKSPPPAVLSLLPKPGKVQNSESFIFKNFLGYAFFHSAFIANYEYSNKKFKIFIMQGKNKSDSQEMLRQYFAKLGLAQEIKEGFYRLQDPYHGEIEIFWQGDLIWGILDLKDQNLRTYFWQLIKQEAR